ncbi:NAD(P)H-dependent flavin oxidoreductase [Porphyromonas circumdentaria]|uniref:Enoyl-[acyl-carrier protein] reductase II n=1 Tax=Porphyromonas circumdentaria TaxID=29524 RepID=A0A1T4L490_9PORP|nr:nitronate monooxygenase [Porphyromonas circumdentaria]MBB6275219.1 enoyl-[acyl-carrier protein] reductase II [Porphyromonas circumdentaria]MDO4721848.1 nitronate monooxygenase [Porphyromonas circumdentaria]SJZ49428.1 enoyl-[acyl-carrier protein] reductase II [Porphyromonas circumdentaria]
MTNNRITSLLGIEYPIIAGGMVWCSGWRLASAVSNAGGLGLIGAGSMHPETLREHIVKCKAATQRPYGVNVPLLYPEMDKVIDIIIEEKVPIVVTSAGNPKTWTAKLHEAGCKVLHVVSSSKFAVKAEAAGVDAIIAEGFEAGGHNGKEETTTMCLIPSVADSVQIPVVAAGGIASGRAMAAAMCLGAEAVQIGTLFAISEESSAHENFKNLCCEAGEGDTALVLKKLGPTRILKREFYDQVIAAEDRGASAEELKEILGKGRAKKGIFEGDLIEGELEIGQATAQISKVRPVAEIMSALVEEYQQTLNRMQR